MYQKQLMIIQPKYNVQSARQILTAGVLFIIFSSDIQQNCFYNIVPGYTTKYLALSIIFFGAIITTY